MHRAESGCWLTQIGIAEIIAWSLLCLSLFLSLGLGDRVFLDIQDWCPTHGSPTSNSQRSGLEACATILDATFLLILKSIFTDVQPALPPFTRTLWSLQKFYLVCGFPPVCWETRDDLSHPYFISKHPKAPLWCSVRIPFPPRRDTTVCTWIIYVFILWCWL